MNPALSLCAAGRVGSGDGGGLTTHTHRARSPGGDRTSGFNGLRMSGPPGRHPGRRIGKGPRQEALPSDNELSPGYPSSTNVSFVFSKTSVSGLPGFSEAGESR